MKCKYLFLSSAMMLFACTERIDFETARTEVNQEIVKANAETTLGVSIDPSQTWSSIKTGSITITADADMSDIAKIQILTESPFFNDNATVLNEIAVQKGDVVTLTYEAPDTYTRLIAACVSSKGYYYIKGFNVGDTKVSFRSSTAMTRGTRSDGGFPDVSGVKLEYKQSMQSYNAKRAAYANEAAESGDFTMRDIVSRGNLGLWQGSHWENDRLWKPTGSVGEGWTLVNNTILREIADIDPEEQATLEDIFNTYLGQKKVNNVMQDNLTTIRNSNVISLFKNHLVSNGANPITIIPVQTASSEISNCHLYYYYYSPSEIPAGMSEVEYIKNLPKFKAIQSWHTMSAAGSSGSLKFFKKHEYLLPYYGSPNQLLNAQATTELDCTNTGVFRIKNGVSLNGEDYYMIYTGDSDEQKLAPRYDDDDPNLTYQLWQIFTTPTDPEKFLLYNVGAKKFLVRSGNYASIFSTDFEKTKREAWLWEDGKYIRRGDNANQYLGSDLGLKANVGIWTDKGKSANSEWYTEAYTGSKRVETLNHLTYDTTPFEVKAVSNTIPAGYRVGFFLWKNKGTSVFLSENREITDAGHGCLYGDGRLNVEINQFPGHFMSASSQYSMKSDDPRIAMFSANGKTYLTFEDGSDCNFTDMIVEIGGSTPEPEEILTEEAATSESSPAMTLSREGTSGILSIAEPQEPEAAAYTLCFEDRPEKADYDMNDVVLQGIRIDANTIQIGLVACGAEDLVVLRGLEGSVTLNNREIHEILHISEGTFANTVKNGQARLAITEYITTDKTIEEYMRGIYIENQTTGQIIRTPNQGEAPSAIIVPLYFNYPLEGQSIKAAYPEFLEWAHDKNTRKDWYTLGDASLIFPSLFRN